MVQLFTQVTAPEAENGSTARSLMLGCEVYLIQSDTHSLTEIMERHHQGIYHRCFTVLFCCVYNAMYLQCKLPSQLGRCMPGSCLGIILCFIARPIDRYQGPPCSERHIRLHIVCCVFCSFCFQLDRCKKLHSCIVDSGCRTNVACQAVAQRHTGF